MKKGRLAAWLLAVTMALQGIADVSPVFATEVTDGGTDKIADEAADDNPEEDVSEGTSTGLPGMGDMIYEVDLSQEGALEYYAGNNDNGGNRQPTYADDTLSFDGGSAHKMIAAASETKNLTDFVYEADLCVNAKGADNGTAQAGLLFRVTEAKPNMSDGYKGYYFGIDPVAQQVILGKANDGQWTEIATKKMSLEYGKFYHATIAVSGNLITAYIDYDEAHYAKVTATDSEFTSGGIGARHWQSSASWKNLKVSEYNPAEISAENSYTNPLLNMCADPDILYYNGTYFLYTTNAGDANDDEGIKVYTSTDLVHWTDQGWAFQKGDGWGESNFWAPDTIERDGVFYMYYTADEHICVAESDSPLGPYKQTVMEPMHSNVKEIDAHVFYDETSEKYYMYFVRFTDGNVIWGAELNDDMKSIKEGTLKELLKANQGWDEDKAKVNEGPYMLTKDGKYYLTYSGSHFESIKYGSAYAVSTSPLGNYTKYANNPIMQSNSLAHGTGHHCVAESPDGKEMFMVYHRHQNLNTTEPRQLCIDRMQFTTDASGNTVLEVNGPTVSPQALPSGSTDVDNFIEFDKADLKPVNVDATASKEDLKAALPAEITVKASKSNDKKASVTWDLDAYTPDANRDVITVTGTATLPEDVANLKNSSLAVNINVMFAELPEYPEMTVKIGNEIFTDFNVETSEYEIKVNELSDVTVEIAESDQNKFKVSVTQATAKNKRAYITITSPLDESYRKTYTIRFRGLIGLMQKMEAEDAKCTGIAKPRNEAAASNGSVVGNIDNAADSVIFEIEAPEAGTYEIGLGVFNPKAWPSASHRYWVNGEENKAQTIIYPQTGGTVEVRVKVALNEGDNTFTVSYVEGEKTFAELDYIALYTINLKEETAQKMEAEDAACAGIAKPRDEAAASNGKVVGNIDGAADSVTFGIEAPENGTYKIGLGVYSPGTWENASHRYWVNGEESNAQTIRYPKIKGCTVEVGVEVELKKGGNTFTVSHVDGEKTFAELDYIVFYTAVQKMEITVGNKALEGFDVDTAYYEVDTDSQKEFPEVNMIFDESCGEKFETEITQATEDRPEAYIKVTSPVDKEYVKEYLIRFYGPDTFQNPLINYGADPYVTYQDGYYYYVRVKNDKSIWVTKSAELWRIGQVEPKKVYEPSGNEPNVELWAPEIHFLNGRWYIYYTAGAGADHRMYALESVSEDAQGAYKWKGKLAPTTDKWAIDQTVLELDGKLYAIWSGWHYDYDYDQRIYIARMDNPWTITGERVELSQPEYDWEGTKAGRPWVNEGPQIAKSPDGTVNIVYSAHQSWGDNYCLGCLTLKKGEDPMNVDAWIKADKPVFTKNNVSTFSTGHASFTTSPDGTEDYLVYHATRFSGHSWGGRGVRAQRVYWNADGTPDMGRANEYNSKVNIPAGTKKVEYTRYEAEEATLNGNVRIVKTNNSSSGGKLEFSAAEATATFHVTAEEAGSHRLYIEAATSKENAAFSVKVNDADAVIKEIIDFNTNPNDIDDRTCVDNWFGYELDIELESGENTVVVSGAAGKAFADLDYIELCGLKKAKAPKITKQPEQASYTVNQTAKALTVEAEVSDGGTLSYQWYQNSSHSIEGAKEIEGATEASYTPSTETVGRVYYYCAVTNTNIEATENQTAVTNSHLVSVTVREEGTEEIDAVAPVITKQPLQASYIEKEEAKALTVEAEVSDGGTLSYQWYQNSSNSIEGAAEINGATEASYTPSTEIVGTVYYYCEVTNTNETVNGNPTAAANSDLVSVTVIKSTDAAAPEITKQPESASYTVNQTAKALTVEAEISDGGSLSYQWYQNSSNSIEGAKAIEGATKASCMPSTETAGKVYYYCAVTNTNTEATGKQTAVTNSNVVSVTVTKAGTDPGTEPTDAVAPKITKQPLQASYIEKEEAKALIVEAEVSDGGTLSYQWYQNNSNSIEGAAEIEGATEAAYTPSTEIAGTIYYYCAVTNTNEAATGKQTAVTNSDVVSVTVTKAGTDPGAKPTDAAEPVIIKQPTQAAYTYRQSAQPLTVIAETGDGGTLSYQWYQNSSNSIEGAAAIQGAVDSSYTPSTETIGTVYYYCTVTNTNEAATGNRTAVRNSAIASVVVDKAENPIMEISAYSKAIGSKLTLKPAGTATYKTSDKKVVTVTNKGKVTFKGIGRATITVNAKGNDYYKAAVKKISFTVTPKNVKVKSVKSSKSKTITVKWQKDKKASGYEVQYAANPKFKGARTKKIKKNSTTSLSLKKLKGGKKYYVRVRSYKTVKKKPIYSSWSKAKQVKVKK